MIRKVKINSFPTELSAVCLGTAGFELANEGNSFEKLDYYYSIGGRFLDTANVYGRWSGHNLNESETVIGKWLKLRGITDMVITSKCCHYLPQAHDVSRVNRECARQDIDDSRKTLGLDEIPIYLTHRDNEEVDVRRIVDFMAELVNEGKVKRFGFSNYSAERLNIALDYMGKDRDNLFVGISNEWSMHEESIAAANGGIASAPDGMIATDLAMYKTLKERNVTIIPFSAAAHGFYSKNAPENMGDKDRESYEALKEFADKKGISINSAAVAYLANSGISTIPVVFVSKLYQLEEFEQISSVDCDMSAFSHFAKML